MYDDFKFKKNLGPLVYITIVYLNASRVRYPTSILSSVLILLSLLIGMTLSQSVCCIWIWANGEHVWYISKITGFIYEGNRECIFQCISSSRSLDNKWQIDTLTFLTLNYIIWFFTHLKLCLATATHNIRWVKITHIVLIWDQTFANVDV